MWRTLIFLASVALLLIAAVFGVAACATLLADDGHEPAVPVIVEYGAEFQQQLAAEMFVLCVRQEIAPASCAVVRDYIKLRRGLCRTGAYAENSRTFEVCKKIRAVEDERESEQRPTRPHPSASSLARPDSPIVPGGHNLLTPSG